MTTANFDLKLKENWYFHLGEVKRFGGVDHDAFYNACKAGGALGDIGVFLNENKWEKVRGRHDWLTALPCDKTKSPSGGYKAREKGWYYCKFELGVQPIQSARLVFDGVLGHSTVYVNGTVAVRNFSGYNRFFCEIGDYLNSKTHYKMNGKIRDKLKLDRSTSLKTFLLKKLEESDR